MPVFTIAYRSRSLIAERMSDSDAEMERLLRQSRARNRRLGITGALLFNDCRFVQILEGDETAVLTLLDDIKRDTRHTDIDVLAPRVLPGRSFADWSMAFIGSASAGGIDAFSLGRQFDWTRATSDLLAALILELISATAATIPRDGASH